MKRRALKGRRQPKNPYLRLRSMQMLLVLIFHVEGSITAERLETPCGCLLAANCYAKPQLLDPAPRLPEESINVTWMEEGQGLANRQLIHQLPYRPSRTRYSTRVIITKKLTRPVSSNIPATLSWRQARTSEVENRSFTHRQASESPAPTAKCHPRGILSF